MKALLTIWSLIITYVCNGQSDGVANTPPSDARLVEQITGTWAKGPFRWTEGPLFTRTISRDGSFTTSIGHANALVTYQGIWVVKDQVLFMTVTNAHGTGNHEAASPVGHVETNKIIYVDGRKLIYETEGHTNTLIRW